MIEHPVIAIVGAGAVGCYYGGRLAQHGHSVHFLMRSDYEHVVRHGLEVRSVDGDFVLPADQIRVYRDAAAMPKADLVIVTLKTTANDQYEPLVGPLLKPATTILTLQNGLGNEQRLAELFGGNRVLGGMAFVCINRISRGVVHHMDYGLVKIGQFEAGSEKLVEQIAELMSKSGIRCTAVPDLERGRWEKLIWNVPFNGLSALMDLTTDLIINNPDGIVLVRGIMREVIDASRAHGVAFDEKVIEEQIKRTQTMGAYRTSMQIDRQNGRPMEIEAIIGRVVSAAASRGVSTVYTKTLYHQLRVLESNRSRDEIGR